MSTKKSSTSQNAVHPVLRSTADFARYVGLARTTVSRVLNAQPGLRSKTIERVRQAMEETGFTPNAHATNLRKKRTRMIGVYMENLHTPPIVAKLAALQRMLRAKDYTTLIEVFEAGRSRQTLQGLLSLRVDAVIFIGHFNEDELTQRIDDLRRHEIAHVVIDQVGIRGANTVSLDRAKSMTLMMEHLWGLGHRRFGLLGFSGPHRSTKNRLEAAKMFLTERQCDLEQALISFDRLHERKDDMAYGRALAGSFLNCANRPTALVALNDEVAIGAIHGLQAGGLRVPQDISVAGFNNLNLCFVSKPQLTSIDQQIEKTAACAVRVVFDQVEQKTAGRVVRRWIEPVLYFRDSTGRAP